MFPENRRTVPPLVGPFLTPAHPLVVPGMFECLTSEEARVPHYPAALTDRGHVCAGDSGLCLDAVGAAMIRSVPLLRDEVAVASCAPAEVFCLMEASAYQVMHLSCVVLVIRRFPVLAHAFAFAAAHCRYEASPEGRSGCRGPSRPVRGRLRFSQVVA